VKHDRGYAATREQAMADFKSAWERKPSILKFDQLQLLTVKDECHVVPLLRRKSFHIYITLHLKNVYAGAWDGVCSHRRKEILLHFLTR
jgi:hypothetical protein